MQLTNIKKKISPFRFNDQAKLNDLSQIALDNVEDIYDFFGVKPFRGQKLYSSKCFIHGGDNKSALNLYYNADYRVHFKCRSHGCEKIFGSSLISMVRGGLSKIQHDWKHIGDTETTFDETVAFLLDKFGLDFNGLKGKVPETGAHEFSRVFNAIHREEQKGTIDREFYRSKVEIPSPYYLKRGFSIEVLDDYDVGTCHTYGKPMFNRAMVPIYDEAGDKILGFTGRSIFEKCNKCASYHNPTKECSFFPKWRHTSGLNAEKILYNYSKALPSIRDSHMAILVESPGNVWRLEESGIHNSLAIFGTTLNDTQQKLVDESGAMVLLVIMDSDKAGQEAAAKIADQCSRTYNVQIVPINKNDIGEMSIQEVQNSIGPWIKKATENIERFFK